MSRGKTPLDRTRDDDEEIVGERLVPAPRPEKNWVEIESRCASGLGIVWLVLGSVCTILGIWLGNPGLFAFGLVLVTIPAALFLTLRQIARRLSLVRISPNRVHEGSELSIELRLENRSSWTCFFPRVSEIFPPEIHAQKDLILTDRLLPGETASTRYSGFAILPRGVYEIGPSVLRVGDPFGWFEIRRELDARGELIVYPSLHELTPLEKGGDAVTAIHELLTAADIGDESEIRGIREYRIGDSPRRIHWPLTARHRTPVVKEFHPVVTGDHWLFLDLNRHAVAGLGRTSSIETAIRITASIANLSLTQGHRVAVVAGSEEEEPTPRAGGARAIRDLLDDLVRLRSQDPKTLDEWLPDALNAAPRGSAAVIYLSPYLFDDSPLWEGIADAIARGVRVVAVIFDEGTYSQIWAKAKAHWTVTDVVRRLETAGARTIVVPCSSDLEPLFERAQQDRGRFSREEPAA